MTLLAPLVFVARATGSVFLKQPTNGRDESSFEEQLTANWDKRRGGYRAGRAQYANVWIRDSFFALMAPIPERVSRLKQLCNRLKRNMSRDGHVPFTFNEILYVPTVFFPFLPNRRSRPRVSYKDEKLGNPVIDGNAQYVIMVRMLKEMGQDMSSHNDAVRKALVFLETFRRKDGLIHEDTFGGSWEDTLLQRGPIPYTNVLVDLARGSQSTFAWALDPSKHVGGLDTVTVSMIALMEDYPDVDRALERLLNAYWKLPMVPNREQREAPSVFLPVRVIGQGGYHTMWNWSWVGCLFCAALATRGYTREAIHFIRPYRHMVNLYGTLHEVYDEHLQPVRRVFYRSEAHFSEALGCFLLARHLIDANLHNI